MRKPVYERNLASEFGRLKLEEITPAPLMARCEKIKERGAAAPCRAGTLHRSTGLPLRTGAGIQGGQSGRGHPPVCHCYVQAA
jgi:hypothetical protein